MQLPEREAALSLLSRLAQVGLGAQLVLAGSSGLFATSATLPALTEDLDFLVDAEWLAEHEHALLTALRGLGFEHHAGTCTFTDAQGSSLDLVGYSLHVPGDRIGGGATVPVMVYGDLGVVMSDADATLELPGGGCALSPAALTTVKLLTVRVEKGGKDKLQALLLIDEQAARPGFATSLMRILTRFPADRVDDALADAQAAFLALSSDALLSDAQSRGYAAWTEAAGRGLARLSAWRGSHP